MSDNTKHIVNINDDTQLECTHCGVVSEDFTANLPVGVEYVINGIRNFENAHRNCLPLESQNEGQRRYEAEGK